MFTSKSIPARILIFTIAAGAALFAAVAYIPPLLRPGIPVSHFRELPSGVANDLNLRGCNIVRGNNVISEDFDGSGQRDWAVLCQRDHQASLFLYLAGSDGPAIFGTNGAGLVADPEGARRIRVVDWDYVARHNLGLRADTAARACIEDGAGIGSSIYCYLNGAWVPLAGAD
jgi:hypothetical protein